MRKDCNYFSSLITGYIDGELNTSDSNEVKSHLDVCSECKEHYLDEKRVKSIIKEKMPIIKAPVALQRRIRHQLIRNGNKPGFWQLVHSLFAYRPFAASFALAVIICLVFFPTFQMLGNSTGADTYSEQANTYAELKGEIICLDCEYLSQNPENVNPDPTVHRAGIKTDDNHIWTFVNSKPYRNLLHNQKLLSKKARVTGFLFRNARYIYVKDLKML